MEGYLMRFLILIGLALLAATVFAAPASAALSINSLEDSFFMELGDSEQVSFITHVSTSPDLVDFDVIAPSGIIVSLHSESAYTTSPDFQNALSITIPAYVMPGEYVVTVKAFASNQFAEKNFKIYVPSAERSGEVYLSFESYPKTCLTVFRDDAVNATLTLKDQGVFGSFAVELLNLPEGVEAEFFPSSLFTDMGHGTPDIQTANVNFKVGKKVELGEHNLIANLLSLENHQVKAQSPICLNVVKATGAVISLNPTELELEPGEQGVAQVTVKNTSTEPQEFFLATDKEYAVLSKARVSLKNGETATIDVVVNLPEDVMVGSQTINIQAKSAEVERVATLTVIAKQEAVTVSTDLNDQEIVDDEIQAIVTFRNNTRTDYSDVKVSLVGVPSDWAYEVTPAVIDFKSGASKSVQVTLKPSKDIESAKKIEVVLTAKTPQGEVEVGRKTLQVGEFKKPTAFFGLALFNPLNILLILALLGLAYFSFVHLREHFDPDHEKVHKQHEKWMKRVNPDSNFDLRAENTGVELLKSHIEGKGDVTGA